jgi:hypothetical protein
MTRISKADKWSIITWKKEGLGARLIQRKLQKVMNTIYSLAGIQKLIKKFESTGDIRDQRRIRCKTARTPQNVEAVRNELGKKTRNASPKRTPRRLAQKLKISRASVARILKYDVGAKAYKVQAVQNLNHRNKEH